MLSPDGRCKTFDKDANGYVRGEGVGAILLKPLSQAIEDNDYIYDEINVEGKMYNFKSGEKNFVNELSTHFPEERENIIRYLDAVKKVAGKDLFFSLKIVKNPLISKIIKYFVLLSRSYRKHRKR